MGIINQIIDNNLNPVEIGSGLSFTNNVLSSIGGSGSAPIEVGQIAFGTGTGITSSPANYFDQTSSFIKLSGYGNGITYKSYNSAIIGGGNNNICYYSNRSSIIGGQNNLNYGSNNASIIGGDHNLQVYSTTTALISAYSSCIYDSYAAAIIGGSYNQLDTQSDYSTIIGGQGNYIGCTSLQSSIIGGGSNCIYGSYRSVIIGGQNQVLSSQPDTVLVPSLIISGSFSMSSNYGISQTFSTGDGTIATLINGVITNIV